MGTGYVAGWKRGGGSAAMGVLGGDLVGIIPDSWYMVPCISYQAQELGGTTRGNPRGLTGPWGICHARWRGPHCTSGFRPFRRFLSFFWEGAGGSSSGTEGSAPKGLIKWSGREGRPATPNTGPLGRPVLVEKTSNGVCPCTRVPPGTCRGMGMASHEVAAPLERALGGRPSGSQPPTR